MKSAFIVAMLAESPLAKWAFYHRVIYDAIKQKWMDYRNDPNSTEWHSQTVYVRILFSSFIKSVGFCPPVERSNWHFLVLLSWWDGNNKTLFLVKISMLSLSVNFQRWWTIGCVTDKLIDSRNRIDTSLQSRKQWRNQRFIHLMRHYNRNRKNHRHSDRDVT